MGKKDSATEDKDKSSKKKTSAKSKTIKKTEEIKKEETGSKKTTPKKPTPKPVAKSSTPSKEITKEEPKVSTDKKTPSLSSQVANKTMNNNQNLTNFFKPVAAKEAWKPKDMWDYFQLDEKYHSLGFSTRAIHCGNDPSESKFGGVAPAIDLSTTFAQPHPGQPVCFDYARCGNPTRLALERNLASLEKGKYAFALNSGCSATISVMNLLSTGDHVLCIDDVYGGTQRYLRRILSERSQVELSMVDFTDLDQVRKNIKPNTKIVWAETPTNPTLKVCDIEGIAKICKEMKVLFVVDNTFFSPYLQNPLELGADIVVHSITKYIGGHSDVVMGCIVLNDKELYDRLFFTIKSIGSGASPFDCYLALRGSKTLAIRMEKAQENAKKIAAYLEGHKKVERVIYPGLKSHPQYELVKKQSRGPGAMISFYIKGDIKMADRFLKSLKVFTLAESLGGVESLIENPALMTHGSVPPETRKLLGIEDNFIRISAGIEDIEDLMSDIKQALEKA